jgi:hypothetical protein
MTQQEFETLMTRIDETYSSQPKMNDTQKSIFYAAMKDMNYKDVVVAFIEHTKVDQWKPTVPKQLLMHMPVETSLAKKFVLNFFDRKTITDLDAVKVLKMMGHDRLRRSLEKDLPDIIEEFNELYKARKFKDTKKRLPEIITSTARALQWKK